MTYADVFKKPLDKHEVANAVRAMVKAGNPTPSFFIRSFRFGVSKAMAMSRLLDDAGVTSPMMRGRRTILLKDPEAAVNAALRQLKKGEM